MVLATLGSGLSLSTSGDIWLTLVVLIGTVAAVIWLALPVPGPKTPSARELASRFEMVRAMSGRQLEIFVAELFQAMGHRATMLGGAGNQGVDIVVVSYHGERVAVQCKNSRRAVGNKPVQEVFAGRGTTAASRRG